VGHAGFMAVGAYTASFLTVKVFPSGALAWLFPVAVLVGGSAAAVVGLVVVVGLAIIRELPPGRLRPRAAGRYGQARAGLSGDG